MNPKYRIIYLLIGFIGLIALIGYTISNFPDNINPAFILLITIPDMVFFYLAYKTYPVESEMKRTR